MALRGREEKGIALLTFEDLLDFARRRQDGTGVEGAPSTNTLSFLRRKNLGLPNNRS